MAGCLTPGSGVSFWGDMELPDSSRLRVGGAMSALGDALDFGCDILGHPGLPSFCTLYFMFYSNICKFLSISILI